MSHSVMLSHLDDRRLSIGRNNYSPSTRSTYVLQKAVQALLSFWAFIILSLYIGTPFLISFFIYLFLYPLSDTHVPHLSTCRVSRPGTLIWLTSMPFPSFCAPGQLVSFAVAYARLVWSPYRPVLRVVYRAYLVIYEAGSVGVLDIITAKANWMPQLLGRGQHFTCSVSWRVWNSCCWVKVRSFPNVYLVTALVHFSGRKSSWTNKIPGNVKFVARSIVPYHCRDNFVDYVSFFF